MHASDLDKFFTLNRDNRWRDFQWHGLELSDDGSLQLASLPSLVDPMPGTISNLPEPDGPAGIALTPDGSLYFSDPAGHRVLKIEACDGSKKILPCVGGEGSEPTRFRKPRGLLFHPKRQALIIADSENHRLQLFDIRTLQLVDVWGQTDPLHEARPGNQPGEFNLPWSLAGDDEGNVYVVDYGNSRVQKFDYRACVQPEFWENVLHEAALQHPSDIAIGTRNGSTEVFILDAGLNSISVFDSDGHFLRTFSPSWIARLMGVAVGNEAIYIGDNARRRLLKFTLDGAFIGEAPGFFGPTAALAFDHQQENLWLHPGSGEVRPLSFHPSQAYVKNGVMWGGPFGVGAPPVVWHTLKSSLEPLAASAHIQLFVYKAETKTSLPAPSDSESLPEVEWQPLSLDVAHGLILGEPSRFLWVGAHFTGEGRQTPRLAQIKINYDHLTYSQHLPTIYRNDSPHRESLERLLALFESFFVDAEERITKLSKYFDAEAAPPAWLSWLAGWLEVDLDDHWPEAQKRQAIATGFARHGRRGTSEGLREALHFFTGAHLHITEPILHAAWWALPSEKTSPDDASLLGFNTMLAPAEAQGAVVGTSAVLDQSHLITQEEFGAPLFEEFAHQFCVQIYSGADFCEQKRDTIREIIEREKPAHTAYHLCVIPARMRVGFQSRLGIDTIVAGPLPGSRIGEVSDTGRGLRLGGELAGRIGEGSRVGLNTRVG